MQRRFRRLAIVNRGEPAKRVIHAVRELNYERDEQIRLIALYTDAESAAMFVRHADEAVCVGPSTAAAEDGARRSAYLDYAALERALTAARADAAWVGWGFVAEDPEFVELCDRLGIVFVGPDAAMMRRVGDKIEAKRLAEAAGVPVAPWSGGPVETFEEAEGHAERIGFPLMVKAAAGGGGRGIRRVDAAGELPAVFASARSEALQAFGDATLFLERLVTPARQVEVQVIADGQGAAWAVGLRDCSCRRRNQKVIEESACPALTAEQQREVMQAARRLALCAGYRNAGTVEFLYEPAERRFSFMEVNARLQVEHPVTEAVAGLWETRRHVFRPERHLRPGRNRWRRRGGPGGAARPASSRRRSRCGDPRVAGRLVRRPARDGGGAVRVGIGSAPFPAGDRRRSRRAVRPRDGRGGGCP